MNCIFFFLKWGVNRKNNNSWPPFLHLWQSYEQDGRSKDSDCGQIQEAANAITNALSKHHNSSIILAVVEVKVEILVECPPVGESLISSNNVSAGFLSAHKHKLFLQFLFFCTFYKNSGIYILYK